MSSNGPPPSLEFPGGPRSSRFVCLSIANRCAVCVNAARGGCVVVLYGLRARENYAQDRQAEVAETATTAPSLALEPDAEPAQKRGSASRDLQSHCSAIGNQTAEPNRSSRPICQEFGNYMAWGCRIGNESMPSINLEACMGLEWERHPSPPRSSIFLTQCSVCAKGVL